MHEEIAVQLCLVCHGNAALKGITAEPLLGNNPLLSNYTEMVFMAGSDAEGWTQVAADPEAFFERLKQTRAYGLKLALRWLEPHLFRNVPQLSEGIPPLAGVELVDRQAQSEIWGGIGQETPQGGYRCTMCDLGTRIALAAIMPRLATAEYLLRSTLKELSPYARQIGQEGFAQCFNEALHILEAPPKPTPPNPFAPAGVLTPQAWRLLNAREQADVFGGMGSWNDLNIDDESFEPLSELLLHALSFAAVAIGNSTFDPK